MEKSSFTSRPSSFGITSSSPSVWKRFLAKSHSCLLRSCILCSLLLMAVGVRQEASATVYLTAAYDAQRGLFGTLDVSNRTYTVIDFTHGYYSALATQGGQLYAPSLRDIYTLNRSNGNPTYYGRVDARITGATFDSKGTFYAVDDVESMFGTISPPPTVFTPIGKIINEKAYYDYGSLAYLDGAFYESRTGITSTGSKFMKIDPITGVGTIVSDDQIFGQMQLFSYENHLWGISNLANSFAHLYEIDPANGAFTDFGEITGSLMPRLGYGGFTGAVDVPVPEPSTFALLGFGAVGVLFWRKRRNSN